MRTLILALLAATSCLGADSIRQMRWDELATLVDKSVSVVMPGGVVVSGKCTAVEPDALLIKVSRTTDRQGYPKGPLRVSRATLHTLQMNAKGHKFRVIGTVVGSVVGLTAGGISAIAIQGGLFDNNNPAGAAAAFIGIGAVGGIGGYALGNAADRRAVTIEIIP